MMKRIPLTMIYGNPNQPRRMFDPVKLGELADLLGAMVKDIKRLETALRVSSIEMGIAA